MARGRYQVIGSITEAAAGTRLTSAADTPHYLPVRILRQASTVGKHPRMSECDPRDP